VADTTRVIIAVRASIEFAPAFAPGVRVDVGRVDGIRVEALFTAARRWLAARTRARDAAREQATRAHRDAALAVLRQEAADVIARGAAQLVVDQEPDEFYGDPTYRLVPRNPRSSPVEVHADWSGTYVHVGHHQSLHELWRPDVEERGSELRECVAAVIGGRYEEHREAWKGGTRLTMTFHGPTRPVVVRHHSGTRFDDEPPFGTTPYEPY
jgi:hypothetical protein